MQCKFINIVMLGNEMSEKPQVELVSDSVIGTEYSFRQLERQHIIVVVILFFFYG